MPTGRTSLAAEIASARQVSSTVRLCRLENRGYHELKSGPLEESDPSLAPSGKGCFSLFYICRSRGILMLGRKLPGSWSEGLASDRPRHIPPPARLRCLASSHPLFSIVATRWRWSWIPHYSLNKRTASVRPNPFEDRGLGTREVSGLCYISDEGGIMGSCGVEFRDIRALQLPGLQDGLRHFYCCLGLTNL